MAHRLSLLTPRKDSTLTSRTERAAFFGAVLGLVALARRMRAKVDLEQADRVLRGDIERLYRAEEES